MNRYIALLRGVNVSGQKKIVMAELRAQLLNKGLINVKTYIQSGNVIFDTPEKNKAKLEIQINKVINNHFGFEVPVLIKTPKELRQIFDDCPFPEEKKKNSYFALLYSKPDEEDIHAISRIVYPNEVFKITKNCVYFYSSVGYGKAKMNNNVIERKLKVIATARNYKTMLKLLSLSIDN